MSVSLGAWRIGHHLLFEFDGKGSPANSGLGFSFVHGDVAACCNCLGTYHQKVLHGILSLNAKNLPIWTLLLEEH